MTAMTIHMYGMIRTETETAQVMTSWWMIISDMISAE